MTFSYSVVSGVFFDIRYIIIYFGMIFGGLQIGFVILAEFVIYRFYIGGGGEWVALAIMLLMFPLLILFHKINKTTRRSVLVTISAGITFSLIPFAITYYFLANYVSENLTFFIFALPIQNAVGIWLLVSLFKKSVSDKELFINFSQHEKVLAISHLAASFAHEVRNPLTAVKGFLQLIRENTQSKEKMRQYIDISLDEIQRTETILSEYLSLSKPLTNRHERVNLSQQLQIILDVMTPYANINSVQIQVEITDQPTMILANPEVVKQVLVNFLKNAVEACAHVSNGKVFIKLEAQNNQVVLKIRDNGNGMTEDQVNSLGNIYFSTKSSGTGLGLTFSYQVIRSLSGMVSVSSEPQAGTLFTITLPRDCGKTKVL
jgi:two-component system sporulation sensor kinase B